MSRNSTTDERGMIDLCIWSLRYAFRRWLPLSGGLLAMLLKIGLDLLRPWPMLFLVDYVLGAKVMPPALARFVAALPGGGATGALVGWAVGATVLIFLLGWAVGLASVYAGISLGQRMVYDLAADLFARLQQLSLRFHTSKSVGDNIRRVTADCICISTIVKDALLPVISSAITVCAMVLVLWRLDPWLTLLAVAVVPYMIIVLRLYAGPMLERSYEQQQVESKIYEVVEQTFVAIPIVQAFSREELNDRRFRSVTAETITATLSLTNLQLRFKILMGLSTAIGTALILWFGTQHALAGAISIGSILVFLSYLAALYDPLASVMYTSSIIQGAAGSARRVRQVLESEVEVRDKPGARTVPRLRGALKFDNVSFSYDGERSALRDIALEISPGETIALVGPTGAGKSTLASLVPRFFDPSAGVVSIDGYDLRDLRIKELRQQVALVLQEPFLFPLSIAENIAYGKRAATFSQIEAAARVARADEFIRRLPDGYRTIVGERGVTLSGGERQRLSIARALLKDAPLLILDEPTSALDSETERLFVDALRTLCEGRTTIIIAHRLSTIHHANRIVVLDEGRIAEQGTHAQLLARNGLYSELYRLYAGASQPGAKESRK